MVLSAVCWRRVLANSLPLLCLQMSRKVRKICADWEVSPCSSQTAGEWLGQETGYHLCDWCSFSAKTPSSMSYWWHQQWYPSNVALVCQEVRALNWHCVTLRCLSWLLSFMKIYEHRWCIAGQLQQHMSMTGVVAVMPFLLYRLLRYCAHEGSVCRCLGHLVACCS